MSGKFLARVSAMSLAIALSACGGDESSAPIVNVGTGDASTTGTESPSAPTTDTEDPTTEPPTTGTQTPGDTATPSTLALGTGVETSFTSGTLGVANSSIESGATTELDFNIVDTAEGNALAVDPNAPNSLAFTSACLDSGRATIEAPSAVTSGRVLATYSSGSCIGTDTVYAFLNGSADIYASEQITIAPPQEISLVLGNLDEATNSLAINQIESSATQPLPVGSSVRLSVDIVDQLNSELQIGQPFTVRFSAQCASNEIGSSFSQEQVSTTTGTAETIYTVGVCPEQAEQQTVYAQLVGQADVQLAQVSINTETAYAFQLVAETPKPQSIAPSFLSQEDRETVSIVGFTLEDSTVPGTGIEGTEIELRIDEPDVAEFVAADGSITDTVRAVTDAQGHVAARVRAKKDIDHKVFRVIATSGNLETLSMPIAVNSKLPYEPRFSISTTNFAPDVQGKDGVQVELMVLAADSDGTRIRGNTPVNFSTTKGSIDPDCQLSNEGRCIVTWESLAIGDAFTTVTATTHGRREDGSIGEISDSVTMLLSTSDEVQVELARTIPDPSLAISAESNIYCATTWVTLPNQGTTRWSPPTGTTIAFNALEGELLNGATANATIGSDESLLTAPGFLSCTEVKPAETVEVVPDGSGGTIEQTTLSVVLDVTVTPPGENATVATDLISEQTQP